MKKALKITGLIVGVIVLVFAGYLYNIHLKIQRGDLVKWDNKWYTKEEWDALVKAIGPQYVEVPAKNTPEEVYAKFRQALLNNDIEGALDQIVTKNREKYREVFIDYQKNNGSLKNLGGIYPEKIIKDHEYGNFASYSYKFSRDKKEIFSIAQFEKNSEGYWQIDII